MDFVDVCPPAIVERVRGADLSSGTSSGLFSWIAAEAPAECQLHSIAAIADRLDARSHPVVVQDFCATVASFARFLPPAAIARVEAAYRRFGRQGVAPVFYYLGLRETGIDIRDHLRGRVAEDWSFTHPRDENAETWHYYLYLASLGEPGALEALADKIAATESGNEVSHFLRSLTELRGEEVTEVLRRYENDTRREKGMEGPGAMVSETVRVLLQLRAMAP